MSRPREFNETEALSGAMNAFWTKGYDGTSIPDLLQATGLSRSSLYETFGGKDALFEAATDLYFRTYGHPRAEALRQATSANLGCHLEQPTEVYRRPKCAVKDCPTSARNHRGFQRRQL